MIPHRTAVLHQDDVGIDPEDLVAQIGLEAVHHGEYDNQGRNAEKDSGDRYEGDNGNEHLFPSRPQVTQADEKFIGRHQWMLS
jgi:hypothetical protein